jgi:hypothetical protein
MMFSAIDSFVLLHCVGGRSKIWIYKPEHHASTRKFLFNAPHLWQVAIGDRTVGRRKKENNG